LQKLRILFSNESVGAVLAIKITTAGSHSEAAAPRIGMVERYGFYSGYTASTPFVRETFLYAVIILSIHFTHAQPVVPKLTAPFTIVATHIPSS
jgi:hypothetical protein